MLSDLGDTYRQYKSGTRSIITWLANTAIECDPSEAHRFQHFSRSTMQAKDKNGSYLLQTSDFTKLARIIVTSSKSDTRIPIEKIQLIKDTIDLRTQCAAWYTSRVASGHIEIQDDGGHSHFIEVLRDLLRMLEPHATRAPRAPTVRLESHASNKAKTVSTPARPSTPGFGVESYYAPLPEIASSTENIASREPSPSRPSTPGISPRKKKKARATYDVESSEDDMRLAVFCFFEKLETVRKFIRDVWHDFVEEKVHLAAAYMSIVAAVQVARAAEYALTSEFEHLTDYRSFAEALHVVLPTLWDERDPKIPMPYVPVYLWLSYFCNLKREEAPVSAAIVLAADFTLGRTWPEGSVAHFETMRPLAARLFAPELHPLIALLFYFYLLRDPGGQKGIMVAAPDFLTAGVAAVFTGAPIPIWLILAGQAFIDVYAQLENKHIQRVFELTLATCQRQLRAHEMTSKVLKERGVTPNFEHRLLFAKAVIEDKYVTLVRSRYQQFSSAELPSLPMLFEGSQNFFRVHTFLCGKIAANALSICHDDGLMVFNTTWDLFSIAHLYNAGRQSGSIKTAWEDLEVLIRFHGESNIFVGSAPIDAGAFLRRFLLARGQSIQTYARNARAKLARAATRDMRKPRKLTVVHDIFLEEENSRFERSARDVQAAVSGMIKRAQEKHPSASGSDLFGDLNALRAQIAEEENHLHFSYLEFYCLLDPVLPKILQELGTDPTGDFWTEADDWTALATGILHVHDFVRRGLKHECGKAYSDIRGYNTALRAVSAVLESYIRESGHVISKRMEQGVQAWQSQASGAAEQANQDTTSAITEKCAAGTTAETSTAALPDSTDVSDEGGKGRDNVVPGNAMAEIFKSVAVDLERLNHPHPHIRATALISIGDFIERHIEEKGDLTDLDLRMWEFVAIPHRRISAVQMRNLYQKVVGQEARARVAQSLDDSGRLKTNKCVTNLQVKPSGKEYVNPASLSSVLREAAAATSADMGKGAGQSQGQAARITAMALHCMQRTADERNQAMRVQFQNQMANNPIVLQKVGGRDPLMLCFEVQAEKYLRGQLSRQGEAQPDQNVEMAGGMMQKASQNSKEKRNDAQAFHSDAPPTVFKERVVPPPASLVQGHPLKAENDSLLHRSSHGNTGTVSKPDFFTADVGVSVSREPSAEAATVGGSKGKTPHHPQKMDIAIADEGDHPLSLASNPPVGETELHTEEKSIGKAAVELLKGGSIFPIANTSTGTEQRPDPVNPIIEVSSPASQASLSTKPPSFAERSTPVLQLAMPSPQANPSWSRFQILRHQAQVNREKQAAKPVMSMSTLARKKMLDAKRQREREEKTKADEVEARRVMIKAQREALEKKTTNSSVANSIP